MFCSEKIPCTKCISYKEFDEFSPNCSCAEVKSCWGKTYLSGKYGNYKGSPEIIILCVILAIQFISTVLFFVGYIVMIRNLTDKEIREAMNRNYYIIDYFREPQKYFFIISLAGLVLSTTGYLVISSLWVYKINKMQPYRNGYIYGYIGSNSYECFNLYSSQTINSSNYCSDWVKCSVLDSPFYYESFNIIWKLHCVYKCRKIENLYIGYKFILNYLKIIIGCGCFNSLVVVIMFIVSKTCVKDGLFKKILQTPVLRYSFYSVGIILYLTVFIISIFIALFDIINYKYFDEKYLSLFGYLLFSFFICQGLSFILFLIGLGLLKLNKSDYEIIADNNEANESLINKNYYTS